MNIFGLASGMTGSGPDPRSAPGSHLVLIFGMGMIGHAIADTLCRLRFRQEAEIDYDWFERDRRLSSGDRIEAACRALRGTGALRISFVWSAGKGGFHTSASDLKRENAAFEDTLQLAERLRGALRADALTFHYVSSAGGLFEGQQAIDLASRPAPQRAYGEMKLQQERLLENAFEPLDRAVYRPSSVYGPYFGSSRHGLINHLVSNGRRGRVTVLDSHVMALRDYVFSGDIGQFIGRHIRFGRHDGDAALPYFLVSSRCASIFEVVGKIQRVLNLKIPFRYDENFGNHSHITFSERVMPPGWRPSPLEVGIRQFLVQRVPGDDLRALEPAA